MSKCQRQKQTNKQAISVFVRSFLNAAANDQENSSERYPVWQCRRSASPIKKSILDSIRSLEVTINSSLTILRYLLIKPSLHRQSIDDTLLASLNLTPSPTLQSPPTKKPMLQPAGETYTPMILNVFLRRLTNIEFKLLIQSID